MAHKAGMAYVAVWAWLVILLFVSVAAVYLPFGSTITTALIFLVATVKAVLIGTYFMHLREESRLVRSLAIIPVILFLIMLVSLIPDIVVNTGVHNASAVSH
ncbi:caa(3)-type oxidase subunit IV [Candidatus Poribacteria bacterium]|nr:caa(3)-type oxidase subunit IV [Candidatus Poribacteria bacterium]